MDGTREKVLTTMIETRATFLKEGQKLRPTDVLSDLIDGKTQSMLKLIEAGQEVLVQQHGTYCTYSGYVESWKAVVTDEIEKDTCFYPTDNEAIETDILFIENGERVPVSFEKDIRELLGVKYSEWSTFNDSHVKRTHEDINTDKLVLYKLTHLKLRDPKFVTGMISKAKTIALESQFTDAIQMDNMFKLFLSISPKTVIISSSYANTIKEHSLFNECSNIHTIKFI